MGFYEVGFENENFMNFTKPKRIEKFLKKTFEKRKVPKILSVLSIFVK